MSSPRPGDKAGTASVFEPGGVSGGGGQGGGYVFADLAELNTMIDKWEAVQDRITKNNFKIRDAIGVVEPPAFDGPSTKQANTYVESLLKAQEHNDAMLKYAEGYIDRLKATRAQYANDDQTAADRQRNAYKT